MLWMLWLSAICLPLAFASSSCPYGHYKVSHLNIFTKFHELLKAGRLHPISLRTPRHLVSQFRVLSFAAERSLRLSGDEKILVFIHFQDLTFQELSIGILKCN